MSKIKMRFVHFKCIPERISYGAFLDPVLLTCKESSTKISVKKKSRIVSLAEMFKKETTV